MVVDDERPIPVVKEFFSCKYYENREMGEGFPLDCKKWNPQPNFPERCSVGWRNCIKDEERDKQVILVKRRISFQKPLIR